ncbi:hypothetical protein FG078_17745 [Vibrio cholerae]|uniref:tetratricopeptide repeat protein n=2 Tax=Vibrio cholerae TaxID=666 RepID=UPI001158116D|nr:hypothetical protein [Vibrio cholerae]EGR0480119.1 hypothetical protein [Vibrio cholerae]EGR0510662.1 hypothetical protein [Vibrio cholerae]MBJ6949303.1 hypothetical protein [Vibrio cholerae]TQP29321.1 hypothetical protein FLL93_18530 [Vibrio cholerae]
MVRLFFNLIILISFTTSAEGLSNDSLIKQSIHLSNQISALESDVQELKKSNRSIELKSEDNNALHDIETRIAVLESKVERISQLASKDELDKTERYLVDRIKSTDGSIEQWANIFSWVGSGWAVIFTLMIFIMGYLHFKKLSEVVKETESNHKIWLKHEAPNLLKSEAQVYLDDIEKYKDEAEKYFLSTKEHFSNVKRVSDLRYSKDIMPMHNEELQENVKLAIEHYKNQDFAEAIIQSKIALQGIVNNRSKIEALQIITNSYLAIKRKDLSVSYDEKLSKALINLKHLDRAKTLFTVAMNRYYFDRVAPNESTLSYLNDLISEYISNPDEEIMPIVAKAMQFKAIIMENNGNKSSARNIYDAVIQRFKDSTIPEVKDVVEICVNNRSKILSGEK